MPEMSANARESSIADAVGANDASSAAAHCGPASLQAPMAPPQTGLQVVAPRAGRLAAVGYSLVLLGSALVCLIPSLRLNPGWAEATVILLSIIAVLTGAVLAIWSFVRPMLSLAR